MFACRLTAGLKNLFRFRKTSDNEVTSPKAAAAPVELDMKVTTPDMNRKIAPVREAEESKDSEGVSQLTDVCVLGYWRQRADERLGDPLPKVQEPLVVRDRDGRPQEDPQAVHCFCVCSGSALLGDLLGVSRSVERDLLSVLSIYSMIFKSMLFISFSIRDVLLFLYILVLCSFVLIVLV